MEQKIIDLLRKPSNIPVNSLVWFSSFVGNMYIACVTRHGKPTPKQHVGSVVSINYDWYWCKG